MLASDVLLGFKALHTNFNGFLLHVLALDNIMLMFAFAALFDLSKATYHVDRLDLSYSGGQLQAIYYSA